MECHSASVTSRWTDNAEQDHVEHVDHALSINKQMRDNVEHMYE